MIGGRKRGKLFAEQYEQAVKRMMQSQQLLETVTYTGTPNNHKVYFVTTGDGPWGGTTVRAAVCLQLVDPGGYHGGYHGGDHRDDNGNCWALETDRGHSFTVDTQPRYVISYAGNLLNTEPAVKVDEVQNAPRRVRVQEA